MSEIEKTLRKMKSDLEELIPTAKPIKEDLQEAKHCIELALLELRVIAANKQKFYSTVDEHSDDGE